MGRVARWCACWLNHCKWREWYWIWRILKKSSCWNRELDANFHFVIDQVVFRNELGIQGFYAIWGRDKV